MNFIQTNRTETARILLSQIGKRVINISKVEYYFNEEVPKEEDGEIEIQFEGEDTYAFEILNDGENIDINLKELVVPEAFEVSKGNFCRWEKKSLFEFEKYFKLKNKRLEKIEVIKDCYIDQKECVFAGIRLTFSNKDKLHFINEGDEARFYLNREDKIKALIETETIIEEIKKDTANNSAKQKTFLVAILNWGLGHATRCIPIIEGLLTKGHQVVLASDGLALDLLKAEFADLTFVELPAYKIRYPQKGSMFLAMLWQTPRLLKTIDESNRLIEKVVADYKVDCIISDNRYGCYAANAYSVFLTHQVNIPLPKGFGFFKGLVDKQNFSYINQYDELWVPDVDGHVLSGALSFENERCLIKNRLVGLLSRMKWKAVERGNFVLVVLSGPEPQRSIFEQKILNQAKFYEGEVVLVRGSKAGSKWNVPKPDNLTIIDLADRVTLNDLLLKARYIICRSGYSSLMDLVALQRTAFIVPTPGQTEQELLAKRLGDQQLFVSCPQSLFNLNKAVGLLDVFEARANMDLSEESKRLLDAALEGLNV